VFHAHGSVVVVVFIVMISSETSRAEQKGYPPTTADPSMNPATHTHCGKCSHFNTEVLDAMRTSKPLIAASKRFCIACTTLPAYLPLTSRLTTISTQKRDDGCEFLLLFQSTEQSLLPLRPAGGEEITLNDHDSLAHLIDDDTVRAVFEMRFALPVLTTRGTPQDHAIPRVYTGLILPCEYRKKNQQKNRI
jgi:hypothetical protein